MGISLDTISAALHDIKISDGTNTLAVNADGSVNIKDGGSSITVDATDLDIRNLVFADDKVDVTGSTVELGATSLAALENITVSATDLDIRNLVFANDKVDVSGSTVDLGATTLAALENITVSATDFDIRDLAFATDKVDVSGSSVTVSATDLDIRNLVFATDKVDVSGSSVLTTPDAYDSWKASNQTVTTTASQIAATALSGRLNMIIQNLGSNDIYIGTTNAVTTATGTKIPKGSSMEMGFGAGASVYAIASSGTADVRVAEFAA